MRTLLLGLAAAAIHATAAPAQTGDDPKRVAPYAATPASVVHAMLDMADVGPRDFVIDLGSGDGRLVIAATQRGARGLGVDIDARLVDVAKRNAEQTGTAERARFVQQDLFETDLSAATVVTIYLHPSIMRRVADKLSADLRPGTRVVVHDFPLPGWKVERLQTLDAPEKRDYTFVDNATLYLYRVPARQR